MILILLDVLNFLNHDSDICTRAVYQNTVYQWMIFDRIWIRLLTSLCWIWVWDLGSFKKQDPDPDPQTSYISLDGKRAVSFFF
jgi:hypothetical protein